MLMKYNKLPCLEYVAMGLNLVHSIINNEGAFICLFVENSSH